MSADDELMSELVCDPSESPNEKWAGWWTATTPDGAYDGAGPSIEAALANLCKNLFAELKQR